MPTLRASREPLPRASCAATLSRRRAGAREPPARGARRGPRRITAHEVELCFGQGSLQLIDAAEIIELDRRLLQRQRDNANVADHRQSRETLAHAHPIVEPGYRQHGGKPPLLIVARKRTFLPAALDVGGDLRGGA